MKFTTLLLITLIAGASSVFAQQDFPLLSSNKMIAFESCFYYAPKKSSAVPKMSLVQFNELNAKQKVCDNSLSQYKMPVSFDSTAMMNTDRSGYKDGQTVAMGTRQNLAVRYQGQSADTHFLTVKINDGKETLVQIKDDEVAFLPAGLLDRENRQSHAYLAFTVKSITNR